MDKDTNAATDSTSTTSKCENARDQWDLNYSNFHYFIGAMALFASPLTILFNAIVILVIKKRRELQKPSNILMSSLAVTDLLVGAIVMPLSATVDFLISLQPLFTHTCMLNRLNDFFMFLLFFATLYHLTIIAWERYVAIQKCVDYKVIVTNRRVKKLVLAAWLTALSAAVPTLTMELVGLDIRIVGGWFTMCASMGAICLVLIAFYYLQVYLGIRKRPIKEMGQVANMVNAKLESKVAKTTGLITAALLFSFIPLFGTEIFGNFFPVLHSTATIRLTDMVTQLNSLFNPLLYCYRDRRFTTAFRELLGKRKPQATQPAVDAAGGGKDHSAEQQHYKKNPTPHLTRPELDSAQGRSKSAPTVETCSSTIVGLGVQQSSSIVITSATIHAENFAPSSQHTITGSNKMRSKSLDPIT